MICFKKYNLLQYYFLVVIVGFSQTIIAADWRIINDIENGLKYGDTIRIKMYNNKDNDLYICAREAGSSLSADGKISESSPKVGLARLVDAERASFYVEGGKLGTVVVSGDPIIIKNKFTEEYLSLIARSSSDDITQITDPYKLSIIGVTDRAKATPFVYRTIVYQGKNYIQLEVQAGINTWNMVTKDSGMHFMKSSDFPSLSISNDYFALCIEKNFTTEGLHVDPNFFVVTEAITTIEGLNSKIVSIDTKISSLLYDIYLLKKQEKKAQGDLDQVTGELQSKYDTLLTKKTDLATQKNTLEAAVSNLEQNKSTITPKMNALQSTIDSVMSKLEGVVTSK